MLYTLNAIAKMGQVQWRPVDISYALLCGYEDALLPQVEDDGRDMSKLKTSDSDDLLAGDVNGSEKPHASGEITLFRRYSML